MTSVRCGVKSCSYNNSGDCCVGKINVGGQGATNQQSTCCGSFLNQDNYSNIAEHSCERGCTCEVGCNVDTCKHNDDCHCCKNEIEVGGQREADYYTQTQCSSFETK